MRFLYVAVLYRYIAYQYCTECNSNAINARANICIHCIRIVFLKFVVKTNKIITTRFLKTLQSSKDQSWNTNLYKLYSRITVSLTWFNFIGATTYKHINLIKNSNGVELRPHCQKMYNLTYRSDPIVKAIDELINFSGMFHTTF